MLGYSLCQLVGKNKYRINKFIILITACLFKKFIHSCNHYLQQEVLAWYAHCIYTKSRKKQVRTVYHHWPGSQGSTHGSMGCLWVSCGASPDGLESNVVA